MPHSSKKRRPVKPPSKLRPSYIIGAIILIVISGATFYFYGSQSGGTVGPTTSAGSCSASTLSATTVKVIYARVDTSLGCFEVELFPSSAPRTVANFVNLTNSGFYNNLVWHRIVKGFVIQTGDPNTRNGGGDKSTWGTGGSSQTVPLEIDPSLHNNGGALGMARSSDPNSGSSQFYVNLGDNSAALDGQYTVFGKVISGMSVVVALGNTPVNSQDQPTNPVYVTQITIISSP